MNKERFKAIVDEGYPLGLITTEMVVDVAAHRHDYIEVVIFTRGSAIHTLQPQEGDASSCTVVQGDCFAILPEEVHSFSRGKSAFYYNLILSREFLQTEAAQLRQLAAWETFFEHRRADLSKVRLNPLERSYLDDCLRHLSRELALRSPGYQLCTRLLALNILVTILRKDPQKAVPGISGVASDRLLTVIDAMERHPEAPSTLGSLARDAQMCISSFTRAMRLMTGRSPIEYLIALRLQKAASMLAETSSTLERIAMDCGFCDANYLVKCFRAHFGVTPGEFRRRREDFHSGMPD